MPDKLSISLLIGGAVSASLLNSTDKAATALSGLNNNLRQLKEAEKSAKSLDSLKSSLDETKAKLKASSAETAKLARAMRNVEKPSAGLKKAFAASKKETLALNKAYRKQVTQISRLRKELQAAGFDTTRFAQTQSRLKHELNQVRAAQQRLTAAQGARKANQEDIKQLQRQAVEVAALGFGLQQVLRPSVRFESAMADVAKVVEFESTEAMRSFGGELKSLSRQIPLTATELAQIAASGGRLGLTADQLPDFVSIVARMATAFDLLPEEAGDAIAKLSNIFDIPITDIERLGDAINELANNTAAREADIVNVLTRVGGTSRQFGLAAKETAALGGAFLALGRPPQIAATAINALLNRLQAGEAQSAKFKEALFGLGLSTEGLAAQIRNNPQQALLGFLETLRDLDNQARAVVLTDLFGQEYADDISILVGGLEEYRKALGLIAKETDYVGGVQREFAARAATTANALQLLNNTLTEVGVNFGSTLLPVVTEVAGILRILSGALATLVETFPTVSAGLGALVAGFIAARIAIVGFRLAFALLKQPLLVTTEALAAVGAKSLVTSTALKSVGAAASAQVATVTALGSSFAILSKQVKLAGKGMLAIASYASAFAPLVAAVAWLGIEWYKVWDAAQKAEEAQSRALENAEKYRDGLQETIDEFERFAALQVKSSSELAELSREELKNYERALDGAEQYWRARSLLEHEHTGEVSRETKARLRIARQGLSDFASLLKTREALQRDHSAKFADVKEAETNALRTAFEKQKKIYDSEVAKLNQVQRAREVFSKSIQDLTSDSARPGDELIADTVLAPIRELQRGQQALEQGSFADAEASAKRTVEQLNALKEAGGISQQLLNSLAQQAGELGKGAFDGLEEQQESVIAQAKQRLQDIKNQFDFLKTIKIGLDESGAVASAESLRAKLQKLLADNPIVVPVQAGAGNDIPTLKDLPANARGGMLRGPGTGTSDSFLSFVSNGEYILRAAAVKRYGVAFLNQLNAMQLPKFATGGFAMPNLPDISALQPLAAATPSGTPLVIDLNGRSYTGTIDASQSADLASELMAEVAKRGGK